MGKNNKEDYRPNDLVLGQLRGYPWWPGYVMQRESSGDYRVVFFGDFTYAVLNKKKIRPFTPPFRNFDKKNQKLTQAIRCAQRILKKETTVAYEREQVLRHLLKTPIVKSKRVNKKAKVGARKPDVSSKKSNGATLGKASVSKGKTKRIKKTTTSVKNRSKNPGKQSIQPKIQKRRNKAQILELVNDVKDSLEVIEDVSQRESSVNAESFIRSKRLKNKMSLSLAMEEFRQPAPSNGARSERGKHFEKGYLDELMETKSMKPVDTSIGFGLLHKTTKIDGIFGQKREEQSHIEMLDQTKVTMQSFEHLGRLLQDSEPVRRDSGFDSDLLDLQRRNLSKGLSTNEVIDLANDKISSISGSKCPSISSKAPFSTKISGKLGNSIDSIHLQNDENSNDFKKIENEMQEVLKEMMKNQSGAELEEKLKEWHKELRLKPNFKFIVSTNIGRHLSKMRNFCSTRVNDTQHYENMLEKIKAFERIIIDKISTTFFGVEQVNLTSQLREQLSSIQNPSPNSKDATLFNQSFPSPKFDRRTKFPANLQEYFLRKNSMQHPGSVKATHQQPQKNKTGQEEFIEDSILGKFKNMSPVQSSLKEINLQSKNYELNKSKELVSEKVDANLSLDQSMYCKVNQEPPLDNEDASVITMKRENSTKQVVQDWNAKEILSKDTQDRVALRIAKAIFVIPNVPQLRPRTAKRIGGIIERLIREIVSSLNEYQRSILELIKFIRKQGKHFYYTFLDQGKWKCNVQRLKVLLTERVRDA
jgi:hypothetical protein